MRLILIIIGGAITINGMFLLVFSNFDTGNLLTLLLGAFLLLWGMFKEKIEEYTKKGFLKYAKYVILFLLSAELLFVGVIAVYGIRDNVTCKEEAVIVLGAAIKGENVTLPLKYRLDTAVEYHEKNPDAYIVVTGGKGLQESVTEAYAMEKYLLTKGVDKDRIIKEERATSTAENMAFSKEILDGMFEEDYEIAVITNNFHILRATGMAKNAGFSHVTHMHAPLKWYSLISCYLRESMALLKFWIVG